MMAPHKHRSTPFMTLMALLALTAAAAHAAVSVDFRQDANNDAGYTLGQAHWINSIVQASNAMYFEGMGLSQRVILTDLPGTNAAGTQHSLTFGHQWTKGGTHAFDWLMSWQQAEATGTAELQAYASGTAVQQVIAYKCGNEIAATMLPVCNSLTAGSNYYDVDVPDDTFLSANGSVAVPLAQQVPVQPRINAFELAYGNRTIRIWADAPITGATLSLSHSVGNGADTGDSTVNYVLTWTTSAKSTQAVIWMAAHIAVGNDAATLVNLVPGGWGEFKGASQINGGPYHFTLDRADNVRLGNQDNQLKGSSVRALPECNLSGPTSVCPYSTNTYTITSDDPAATFQWYFSGSPNGASFVGDTTGSTVQVLAGACNTSFKLCVTVTDSTGLSNNCCIDVLVEDAIDPTASNPDPVTVQCIGDVPDPDVTVVDDEDDNCDENPIVTFVSDVSDGNTCPEVITRTYRVTDDCGNTKDVTQTITVDDTIDPTASNPDPVTVECIGDVPDPDPEVVDDEDDNCDESPTVAFVSDVSDGKTCPETITRTYSVTDDCGNSINVTQTITVDDTTDPTASNPEPITVQCIGDVPDPDVTVVDDEDDNCDESPTVAWVSDVSDGETCPETITRTYSVTDDCGNSINVTQTITVDDTTDPTASNPAPVTVECQALVPPPDISDVTDEADNCDASPTVEFVGDVSDGKTCPETITRTYSVTDDCGNSINVTQTITVDDTIDPTASNPAPVTVECIADVPAPNPSVVTDEADNCDASPTVAFVGDSTDGNTCPETITRTYSVTDDCGNSINVTQIITVDDTIDPTASNPDPVTVECIEDVPAPNPEVVTDEADNCDAIPTVTWVGDVSDGKTCPEVITRTYRVTDDCGNTKDVTQTITVDDNTPPTATCASEANVTIAAPSNILDNCLGTPTVDFSRSDGKGAGDPYPIGTPVTVTYTVTDACGNVKTCTYVVSITGP